MRKLVLTEWVSLDGFTSGPDNDMRFVGESFNDEMGKYEDDIVNQADTLVLGRVTYEGDSPNPCEPTRAPVGPAPRRLRRDER